MFRTAGTPITRLQGVENAHSKRAPLRMSDESMLRMSFDPPVDPVPEELAAPGDTPILTLLRGDGIDGEWAARTALAIGARWGAAGGSVLVADACFDAPVLDRLTGGAAREGVSDLLLYGSSIRHVARSASEGQCLVACAGTPIVDTEAVFAHESWGPLIAAFRDAGAALLILAPEEGGGVGSLIEQTDAVVRLGGAADVEPEMLLITLDPPDAAPTGSAAVEFSAGAVFDVSGEEADDTPTDEDSQWVGSRDADAPDSDASVLRSEGGESEQHDQESPDTSDDTDPFGGVSDLPVGEEAEAVEEAAGNFRMDEFPEPGHDPPGLEGGTSDFDIGALGAGSHLDLDDSSAGDPLDVSFETDDVGAVEPPDEISDVDLASDDAIEDGSSSEMEVRIEDSVPLARDNSEAEIQAPEGEESPAESLPPVWGDDAADDASDEDDEEEIPLSAEWGDEEDAEEDDQIEDAPLSAEWGEDGDAAQDDLVEDAPLSSDRVEDEDAAGDAGASVPGDALTEEIEAGVLTDDSGMLEGITHGADFGPDDPEAETLASGVPDAESEASGLGQEWDDPDAVPPDEAPSADEPGEEVHEDVPLPAAVPVPGGELEVKEEKKLSGLEKLERKRRWQARREIAFRVFLIAAVIGGAIFGVGYTGLIELPFITPPERRGASPVTVLEGPVPVNPVLSHALFVDAWRTLETPQELIPALQTRLPDVLFYVTPMVIEGRTQFALMAGPATSAVGADQLRGRIAEVLDRQNPENWRVHESSLAYMFGDYGGRNRAAARVRDLAEMTIPAYVLTVEFADGNTAFRVYGGGYSDEFQAQALKQFLVAESVAEAPLVERRGRRPE